jgi:hypothetical protein
MPFKKGVTPPGAKPFVKGQSGNPYGRPPDFVKTISKLLLEEKNDINGLEAILRAVRNEALKGNIHAAKLLIERAYGSVPQKHELTGNDGGPIEITGMQIT